VFLRFKKKGLGNSMTARDEQEILLEPVTNQWTSKIWGDLAPLTPEEPKLGISTLQN
jgi:hypothetical protein